MDLQALVDSRVGKLVPIAGTDRRWGDFKYFAFVPEPLPTSVELSPATVAVVAEAAMAIGRLDAASDKLPNPRILVRPTLTKEAVSTSALEGTYAPLTEVLEGEIVGRQSVSASAREVLNYVAAAEEALGLLPGRPISLNLIAPLQQILVEGTRGDAFDAGSLRARQVMIGSEERPIEEARFVPPPHEILPEAVAQWEKWIHNDDTTLLVRVALGHYQFETLHPFSDGNGRLGRLIVVLQLIEGGALRYPLLNISEWLEPRRDEYQARLLQLSQNGDHDSWVAFFCTGIKEQSEKALSRIERLLALREAFVAKVRSVPGSRGGSAVRIAEDLIGFPVFDVPSIVKWQNIKYQSADEAIKRLIDLGLVRQIERARGRPRKLFVAGEVLRALEE
jgi:Fic family protein